MEFNMLLPREQNPQHTGPINKRGTWLSEFSPGDTVVLVLLLKLYSKLLAKMATVFELTQQVGESHTCSTSLSLTEKHIAYKKSIIN